MEKFIKSIILFLLLGFSFQGEAKTIRQLFADEPDDVFLILPKSSRLDMLDYYDVGRIVEVENNLSMGNKETKLIKVSDTQIEVALTRGCQVSLTLLPVSKSDTIIAVIKSYQLPYNDSQIAFYDTDWKPLSTKKHFTEPSVKSFIRSDVDKQKQQEILSLVKFPLISYKIEGAGSETTLTATLNLDGIMIKEDYELVKDYLLQSIVYKRSGSKFKLVKQ